MCFAVTRCDLIEIDIGTGRMALNSYGFESVGVQERVC